MPFIEAAVATAQEFTAVPEGKYPLRVSKADIVKVKKDNPDGSKEQVAVAIDIVDNAYPNAGQVYMYLGLPHKSDDEKRLAGKLRTIRRFCEQFDIAYEDSGFNTDDFPGATCDGGLLKQEPMKNQDGEETGEVRNTLTLDKFTNEEENTAEAKPATPKRRRA